MKTKATKTVLATTLGAIAAFSAVGIAQEKAGSDKKTPAEAAASKMTLDEARAYFSYNIGINMASQFSGDKVLDKEEVKKGFLAVLSGKADAKNIDAGKMQQAQTILMENQLQQLEKEATAFLEANKKKDGVKTTKSGLQYKIVKKGSGKKPASTSTVKVHYTGKLPDGTVFDSSVKRGEPATFPLDRVIAGWTEGIQLMEPGAVYELVIPAEIGYGANGTRDGRIPPHSPLVFEVELLEVDPATPAADSKENK